MANSYVEYTTTGSGTNGLSQTTFTAPTKFLSINDIRIKGLNGSTWTELTISSRGTTTVTLSAAPTSGSYSKIRAFRSSTTEPLIDFQNGSRLSESDLDTAYQQGLFVAQEVAEDADPEGGSGIGNVVNSQLAGGITNDKLAGSITQDKLAGGITSAQLAGSIADSKLASGVGTSANNLVKLDGTAKLPAVDGSQLTNINTVTSGTYTPYLYDALSGGNQGGATTADGNYVKIGTLVHVSIRMIDVTKSGLTTGNAAYFSLPFASANIASNYATNYPAVEVLGGTSSSETPPVLKLDPNTDRFCLQRLVDNTTSVKFTVANIGSGFDIFTSITYIAAS